MSIEAYFLVNLLADLTLMSLAARSLGCFRLRRALPLSMLAAGYALLAALHPPLAHPVIQALLLAVSGAWLTGGPSVVLTPPCLLALTASALLAGGIAGRLPASLPFAVRVGSGICLGGGIMVGLAGRRRHAGSGPVWVRAGMDGRSVGFPALIDTGNRLREPLSGQPVLIVRDARVRSILPSSGYRQVAFGSVGGGGTLRCFRPDRLTLEVGPRVRRVPDAWIAIFPGRLPGGVEALAPAEFILY